LHQQKRSMPRILIVEDDPDLRDMMATLLGLEGFDTLAAANGAAALGMLDGAVDAIILDLMMPVMDGWAFRRRQLASAAIAHIPVVVVSALDEKHRGAIPCFAHLPKPVDFQGLIRTLIHLCARPERSEA